MVDRAVAVIVLAGFTVWVKVVVLVTVDALGVIVLVIVVFGTKQLHTEETAAQEFCFRQFSHWLFLVSPLSTSP